MEFMLETNEVIDKMVDRKMDGLINTANDDITAIIKSMPKDVSDRIFSLTPLKAELFAHYAVLIYTAKALGNKDVSSYDDIYKLLTTEQEKQDLIDMIAYILNY